MSERKEKYVTIKSFGESETKVEKSRFIGFAIPVRQLDEVSEHLHRIKKEHHAARHVCYGLRYLDLSTGTMIERSNDDGEPARTAGFPLVQLLMTQEIEDVLLVVVRYFGGIKLGTGGLTRAYMECGKLALEDAEVIDVFPECHWSLDVPYALLDRIEHHLDTVPTLRIADKNYSSHVTLSVAVQWPYLEEAKTYFSEYLGRHVSPEDESSKGGI